MRPSAIDYMTAIAMEDDYIVFITTMHEPITIKNRALSYTYFDYCIRINDKSKREQYMIQLESIEAVKVIIPKFGSNSRKCGDVETMVGA